jgi:FkbM family methyltransferase
LALDGKKSWNSLYLRYESCVAEAIQSNLNRGDTFWDVGASVGLFSLFAARIVGPAGSVVSFEPAPDAFDILCENVRYRGSVIRFLQCAIGNVDGSALLSGQGASAGGSFIEGVAELSKHYYPEVPIYKSRVTMRKLDSLSDDLNSLPALIKIDIEGFEGEAIRGANGLLSTVRPVLIIEIRPRQLGMLGSGHEDELFESLRAHRYDFEVIDRNPNSLYSIIAKPCKPKKM